MNDVDRSGSGRSDPRPIARLRRASRHLRVRVTAAATLAAIVLAVVGALAFTFFFQRSLVASTDAALRTIASSTGADLAAATSPTLAPVSASARTTVLQVIDPTGAVRQTVTTSKSLGRAVDNGRSTYADADQIAAARNGATVYTQGRARVLLTPFARDDGTWTLLVAADLEQLEDAAHEAQVTFAVVVPVVVVLIAAGAWLLSGAVLRPVERMRSDAAGLRRGVAAGTSTVGNRVHEPDSGDRIEALARTLNGLLADLGAAADRQRALVADAGHELRTPLSVLRTELELADRDGRDAAYLRDSVTHARAEVERLSALAEDLLLLADADRRVARDGRPVVVGEIVEDAVRAHRAVAAHRVVTLGATVVGDTRAVADGASLRRVVDNLLGNALAVAHSRVDVVVSHEVSPAGVVIDVDDDGPGFDVAFLPHAFERFTRADDDRHRTGEGGAGLGLAIVAAVADAHGGTATASNTRDGARVRVVVPAG